MSRDDRRSIFDRPVHDHWDKMFDKDHDGWMTPSERAHKQSYLSSLSDDEDSSSDWDDDEDEGNWDDEEKDEWDDEDGEEY